MTVGEIPVPRKGRRSFEFNEVSRTLFAISQMTLDGISLIVLSYLSLSLAILLRNHDKYYGEYFSYFVPTVATTVSMVFMFARAGVYNPLNVLDQIGALKSTMKCLIQTMLLLIGFLFIIKMSDDFSRVWLAAWTAPARSRWVGFAWLRHAPHRG